MNRILCALLLALPALASALAPEPALLEALDALDAGQVSEARTRLEALTRSQPNFRLAQLLYGDLLTTLGGGVPGQRRPGASDPRIQELADEARVRVQQWRQGPPPGDLPDAVLQLSPSTRHVVLTDVARSRLYLLENRDGQLRLARHFYAGIGRKGFGKQVEGDLRTPIGIYRVTGFMGDQELPELYGAGAFPLDYPNALDREKKRTGSGIWIHGVPRDTYVRAPRSSEGCVTVANDDLLALKPYLRAGITPVILSDRVHWVSPAVAQTQRAEILRVLDAWRADWSSRDTERYLSHYASDFRSDGMGLTEFSAYKRRINASKKFIDVQVRDIEIYRYPGPEGLLQIRFTQDYRSDSYGKVSVKQQVWKPRGSGWAIYREASD